MPSTADPPSTIILISGGNSGIGLATAKLLACRHSSHRVIIGSRDALKGAAAVATFAERGLLNVSHIQLDVSSDTSIAAAALEIDRVHGRLDVLVNNAGVMFGEPGITTGSRQGGTPREQYQQTFEVNVFGAACLTDMMLPLLKKSSLPRIVFLSSQLGSMSSSTDNTQFTYGLPLLPYRTSKAAANMLAVMYAMLLKENGGKSNAVCPGMVSSNLNGFDPNGASPEEGADIVAKMAMLDQNGPTATFSNAAGALQW